MKILYFINAGFWIFMIIESLITYCYMKHNRMIKRDIAAFTVVLLSGLNIVRAVTYLYMEETTCFVPVHILLQYFYIGSSVFQLLLCWFVLKSLQKNKTIIDEGT